MYPCRHNLLTMNRQRLFLVRQSLMEFIVGPGDGNLEDRIAPLGHDTTETPAKRQVSLRSLRHLPSSAAMSSTTTLNMSRSAWTFRTAIPIRKLDSTLGYTLAPKSFRVSSQTKYSFSRAGRASMRHSVGLSMTPTRNAFGTFLPQLPGCSSPLQSRSTMEQTLGKYEESKLQSTPVRSSSLSMIYLTL